MRRHHFAAALIAAILWALALGVACCQQAPPPAAQPGTAAPAQGEQPGTAVPPGGQPGVIVPPQPAGQTGATTPTTPGAPTAAAGIATIEQPTAVAPPAMAGPYQRPSPVPHELSIDQAIAIALCNNPGVAISGQDICANAGLLQQAASGFYPHVNGTVTRLTPIDLPPFSFEARGGQWQTNFSLNWLLFNWGATRNQYRAARSLVEAATETYVRTGEQTAYTVRQDYFGVLTARAAVDVQQEVLASAQENLRVARLRYEAGVAPQYDVLAAEARVASVQQELVAAQGRLDIAWALLAQALGVAIPPGTVLSTPRPSAPEAADLPALLEEAFAQRTDLRAAEDQMEAARRRLAATRVGALPTVSAFTSYSFLPSTTIDLGGTPVVVSQNSGNLGIAISWPMFTGGLVEGETETARARYEQAKGNVESVRLQIDYGVRSAFFLVQSAQAQITAGESEVTQATEALRIANLRYREGVGTSVEVLQAEASLQDARTRLNQAVFTLNLAIAALDLAVGTPISQPLPKPVCPVEQL